MEDKELLVVAMIAYTVADVLGSRLHGESPVSPYELADRAAAFGKHLVKVSKSVEAQ